MTQVVTLTYPEPTIALVEMADRTYRNTFSQPLIEGLLHTFEAIQQNPDVKVVVIHGYDNYFCCGGTQEELLNIFEGKIKFNVLPFYRILLDCEIPTISAMQGHGIGGGLAFGCYADLIVMAEECLYSANFMKYGFTPGLGATYIIPRKFGELLGAELLYSANNFHGGKLRERGIPAKVVKKQEVIATALTLARDLADKPRTSLKLLKQHLTQTIKAELPTIIEQELAMHEISFSQPEVRERIETLFGG
ncbi:enoyl-CoA hydratase/isomerase family protein [Chloroflexi bacterium TSY]|nr:enoyl-CoA hydratase/isomerase family protein [Chloroflexi bacterium TSY]